MKVDGKPYRTIWLGADGTTVQAIDQTLLPHAFVVRDLAHHGGRRARHPHHDRARRAADRRGRRLRHGARHGRRSVRCHADARLHGAAGRRARPRSTCAGRSTTCAPCWRRCRRPSGARPPTGAPPRSATRMSRSAGASARTGSAEIQRLEAARRAHQCADPLQRRLARHRRLGHRAGADLPGARCRHPDPCLGRRDAAAQPGRQPDRLGARQARRAAHRDRRQCRRPPDAARPGRFLHRRHRPHDARAATSATRSAPT